MKKKSGTRRGSARVLADRARSRMCSLHARSEGQTQPLPLGHQSIGPEGRKEEKSQGVRRGKRSSLAALLGRRAEGGNKKEKRQI